ncbi:hypothetical protein Hanom_Chr03g00250691 [Helianthus anomalus]
MSHAVGRTRLACPILLTTHSGVQTSRAEPELDQARARARLTYESSGSSSARLV